MTALFEASLQAPTVVFTIGLGIALIYWVFVLVGALDIEIKGIKFEVDGDGHGLWSGLGLGKVPVTITVSMILLVGWCLSLVLTHYAFPAMSAPLQWALLPVLLVAGILIAAVLVRPLAPVFEIKEGKSNRDYVGHTCTVNTGSVDDGFGQATLEDGGTVLQIAVRCDAGRLGRGDKALIIDFDERRQAYVVEPVTSVLPANEA